MAISQTLGSTDSGKVGTGESGVGMCEATRERRRWESGEVMGASERVTPRRLRILWPSRGAGQSGMTRKKKCEKESPTGMHGSGRVLCGKERVPVPPPP